MPWFECIDCGEEFWREDDERWKVRCYPCWREHKDRERRSDQVLEQVEMQRLRQEVERLNRRVMALEGELETNRQVLDGLRYHLRFLLFAAHPDRNGNDPRANDATRWLLEMREILKGWDTTWHDPE